MHQMSKRYYRRRAETEVRLAEGARHPEAAKAHYQIAQAYLAHVDSEDDAGEDENQ